MDRFPLHYTPAYRNSLIMRKKRFFRLFCQFAAILLSVSGVNISMNGQGIQDDTFVTLPPEVQIRGTKYEDSVFYFSRSTEVRLVSSENASIFYTLDGSRPGILSLRYVKPLLLSSSGILRYSAQAEGKKESTPGVLHFQRIEGIEEIRITEKPEPLQSYFNPLWLVDGTAKDSTHSPGTLIFNGKMLTLHLNFGVTETLRSLSLHFISLPGKGLQIPSHIRIEGSKDGKSFRKLKKQKIRKDGKLTGAVWTEILLPPQDIRYLRILIPGRKPFALDEIRIVK